VRTFVVFAAGLGIGLFLERVNRPSFEDVFASQDQTKACIEVTNRAIAAANGALAAVQTYKQAFDSLYSNCVGVSEAPTRMLQPDKDGNYVDDGQTSHHLALPGDG
jgi:hypothetical protein